MNHVLSSSGHALMLMAAILGKVAHIDKLDIMVHDAVDLVNF